MKSTQFHRWNLVSSCRKRTGYSRFHLPSEVTPAQQTVSPYFWLGLGIALTSITTRELWSVTDIAARVIAEEVNDFDPACFQPVGDDGPVTGFRVSLKTKHAGWRSSNRLVKNVEGRLRWMTDEMRIVYAFELIEVPSPPGLFNALY